MKKSFPMKRCLAAIKKDNMAGLGITNQQRTFLPVLFFANMSSGVAMVENNIVPLIHGVRCYYWRLRKYVADIFFRNRH